MTHKFSYRDKTAKKTCAVIRYGAFGDLIQMSSILPALKEQGYEVTVYTTEQGRDVVQHDPHIDHFVVQGKDQVENERLNEFWDTLKKKYDKVINLSESVEATFLAIPGRSNHGWPVDVRRKYLNVNYVRFAHDLAGCPHPSRPKFYPSKEEAAWAQAEYRKMGGKVILWPLAGSSVHKVWPHLDTIIARLMIHDETTKVVLVGDHLCKLLEQGWENEPRVFCRSGEWTIRETLAFAQVCDLVIGPETGVLNAVSHERVPKIITLSHSSIENLTRDWVNTSSLTAKNTPCYPCHRMHYSFEHCHQDEETGQAKCQVDISPEEMWPEVVKWLEYEKCQAQAA